MIIDIKDIQKWDYYFSKILDENKDIFYTKEYLQIYGEYENAEPLLYIYEDKNGLVYYPFLKRKINETDFYDITSQYGYGGPLYVINGDKKELLKNYREDFKCYCENNNIISEFIRFHPLIKNYLGLESYVECCNISDIVYVDLTKSEDEIIKNYKYSNRKSINKAKRNNLNVFVKNDNFKEFYKIYEGTMSRNNANEYYNFNIHFFEQFQNHLKDGSTYYFCEKEGILTSTELVLYSRLYGHSYLGGTDENYFEFCPNNLLKNEIILDLKNKGVKYFILGGGYKKEDGIFMYKKSFNEHGILSFYIGKKIHNEDIYNKLVEDCLKAERKLNLNYFPLYRG